MKLQLNDLPQNLSESYMKRLERIQAEDELSMKAALHALAWIYYAKRKLEIEELLDVIARITHKIDYKFKLSDLTDIYQGLVNYDKSSEFVQFIHSTIKIFLN
jgi:hypothetical protein